jgi:lipoyl(octanoyl) transferase
MADFDIPAFRIEGLTGVHTSEGKVAAIGVHIKRWVTTHGFALNVNTDLSYYNWIIACEGEPVTSMERILGYEVELSMVEDRLMENFKYVFGYSASAIPTKARLDNAGLAVERARQL